jgi:hypothetical protein
MMTAQTKKWVNRAGLAAVAVGTVLVAVAGGTAEAVTGVVGVVFGVAGAVLVLIREIIN